MIPSSGNIWGVLINALSQKVNGRPFGDGNPAHNVMRRATPQEEADMFDAFRKKKKAPLGSAASLLG